MVILMDSEEINGWDREAERAWKNDPHYTELPLEVVQVLKKFLPEKARVLDAGCSIGKHLRAFQRLGYTVVAVEQSKVGVDYARTSNPDTLVLNMRIQDMTFREEFDLIHTSAVLQHSLHERKRVILKKFREALKPGGFYLCTENTYTPNNTAIFTDELTDGYSFTYKGWVKFLAENGFETVKFIPPWPYYLSSRRN